MEKFTCKIVDDPENPDERILELGDELCAKLGWQVGDNIRWTDNKDGTWTLTKVESNDVTHDQSASEC